MLLEGKNAVIYGAGGAVGGAAARALAREGARLFLAGRTLTKVAAVAEDITAAGGMAEAAQVDALDELDVERHISDVTGKAGNIDLLFNAIGMEDIQGTPLLDMALEDFVHPVHVAVRSQFLTARAVARRMTRQGSGVILTITAEPTPAPNVGGFDTACAAVEGLWRSFAAELGPQGVRFGILRSPGSPDTPAVQEVWRLHAEADGLSLEDYLAGSERLPLLAEVADAVASLAADLATAKVGTVAIVTVGMGANTPATEGGA